MTGSPKHPYSAAAFNHWLEQLLDRTEAGGPLPTDEAVAEAWGVSSRTVKRLMSQAARRGVIVRVRGKGTFKAGGEPAGGIPDAPARRSSADRLHAELADGIRRGTLMRGSRLPPVKYLSVSHAVSSKTVIGAYRRLAANGLAVKIGKQYWVGAFSPWTKMPVTANAWLFAHSEDQLSSVFTSDTLRFAYLRMEQELRACGVGLRCAPISDVHKLCRRWVSRREYPCGLVFFRHPGSRMEWLLTTVGPLLGPRRSSHTQVIVDVVKAQEMKRVPSRVHAFSRGNLNTAIARAIAAYAAQSRYESVVLLVPPADQTYSPSAFVRFEKVTFEMLATQPAPNRFRQVILSQGSPRGSVRMSGDLLLAHDTYWSYIREKYRALRAPADLRDISEVTDSFDSVLKLFRGSTLWVCGTDDIAVAAHTWLRQRGIDIPKRIGVVSLESSHRLIHKGISVGSPDWEQFGHLLAHIIIGDCTYRKTGRGFIRPPVSIIDRQTTLQ